MSLTILLHKWHSTKNMQFAISNGGFLGSEIAAKDYKEDFPHSAGGVSQPASMCQD